MAQITFRCEYCGAEVTKQLKHRNDAPRFCCQSCAGKWRAANGMVPVGFGIKKRGKLPYDIVKIRVTKTLEELFQVFRPDVGREYQAEKYKGQGAVKSVGYVIDVNGHRVNIRQNECVEV